jgi:hypothetical protein
MRFADDHSRDTHGLGLSSRRLLLQRRAHGLRKRGEVRPMALVATSRHTRAM